MKKSIISLGQRRFLIIWCCFHLLALAINLADIEGRTIADSPENGYYSHQNDQRNITYLFTNGYDRTDGFWPFVKYTRAQYNPMSGRVDVFYGIFTGYDISEFLVYVGIGLAIVFLPKLWGTNSPTDTVQAEKL